MRRLFERLTASGAAAEERATVAREIRARTRGKARSLALTAWFAASPPPDLEVVRAALLDPSGAVRDVARFEVGRRELAIDVLAVVRAAVETGSTRARARALVLPAEAGERRPEVFAAYTRPHYAVRIREAAYLVLHKLEAYLDDESLVTLLEGESPRIARVASRLLRWHAMSSPALARVRALAVGASPPPQARSLARSLLDALPIPRGQPE